MGVCPLQLVRRKLIDANSLLAMLDPVESLVVLLDSAGEATRAAAAVAAVAAVADIPHEADQHEDLECDEGDQD